jgi:hypothetical protein
MFSVAGLRTLQAQPYSPDFPNALRHQCHLRLSYLLTAAGQFRILTGFPFDPPCGETMEGNHHILYCCSVQVH